MGVKPRARPAARRHKKASQVESNGRDKDSSRGYCSWPLRNRIGRCRRRRPAAGLSLSIGLPAPLGEPIPQEGREPPPMPSSRSSTPSPGHTVRGGQEQTEQHPETRSSPARHSTPAQRYGLHVQRVPRAERGARRQVRATSLVGERAARLAASRRSCQRIGGQAVKVNRQTIASAARGRQ
jgi:hypothetical protein